MYIHNINVDTLFHPCSNKAEVMLGSAGSNRCVCIYIYIYILILIFYRIFADTILRNSENIP